METELLTQAEFAARINKSERQVRRYIEQGRLIPVDTYGGPRLSSADLENWKAGQPGHGHVRLGQGFGHVGHEPDGHLGHQPDADGHHGHPLSEHVPSPATIEHRLLDQLDAVRGKAEALQAELDAQREETFRERRLADQLRAEIGGYQRALSETAESLAEQRAQLIHLEAQRLVEEQRRAEAVEHAHQAERVAELERQLVEQRKVAKQMKIDLSVPVKGWGSRLRGLLFRKVG